MRRRESLAKSRRIFRCRVPPDAARCHHVTGSSSRCVDHPHIPQAYNHLKRGSQISPGGSRTRLHKSISPFAVRAPSVRLSVTEEWPANVPVYFRWRREEHSRRVAHAAAVTLLSFERRERSKMTWLKKNRGVL
ncbi:hypothetical protein EVAR_6166_1 [Eumeta japonica]|uniref:Uncharacterized protein n=1 Tax=Eumeta variegata TaxID=151549 RepID=A0A4C1TFH9_EUMVA|nr:hypothetical protein EVAR_6166_1 [Eumeta japonica]